MNKNNPELQSFFWLRFFTMKAVDQKVQLDLLLTLILKTRNKQYFTRDFQETCHIEKMKTKLANSTVKYPCLFKV